MNDKDKDNTSMNKLTEGPLSFQETINFAMNLERIESRRREMQSGSSSIFEWYLLLGALTCIGLTAVIMYFFDISNDDIKPTFFTLWVIYTVIFVLCVISSSKKSGSKRK